MISCVEALIPVHYWYPHVPFDLFPISPLSKLSMCYSIRSLHSIYPGRQPLATKQSITFRRRPKRITFSAYYTASFIVPPLFYHHTVVTSSHSILASIGYSLYATPCLLVVLDIAPSPSALLISILCAPRGRSLENGTPEQITQQQPTNHDSRQMMSKSSKMSSSSANSKPRQPRLRASCDGCFLAKVKCSKERPICARCLSCGTHCQYSPSSRAGKPKSDASRAQSRSTIVIPPDVSLGGNSIPTSMPYSSQPMYLVSNESRDGNIFTMDAAWSTPSGSIDGRMSGPSLSSGPTPVLTDDSPSDCDSSIHQFPHRDIFDPSYGWHQSSPPNMQTHFLPDHDAMMLSKSHVEIQPLPTWHQDPSQDVFTIPQHLKQEPLQFSPIPASCSPHDKSNFQSMAPSTSHQSHQDTSQAAYLPARLPCNCFATCLQSLQLLHSHSSNTSSIPPFDVVLNINRKAVEGCATMLSCSSCMNQAGSTTCAMLLSTIISNIMSFYRSASQQYFSTDFCNGASYTQQDNNCSNNNNNNMAGTNQWSGQPQSHMQHGNNQLSLSFGSYRLQGEDGRWFEIELLIRELRKLEELLGRFRDVMGCGGMGNTGMCGGVDESGMVQAVVGSLSQNLKVMFDVLNFQKEAGLC